MSKALDEAKAMLPFPLHDTLDRMIAQYKFACLKHHGLEMVSPKVIAELILMDWRSDGKSVTERLWKALLDTRRFAGNPDGAWLERGPWAVWMHGTDEGIIVRDEIPPAL